MEIILRVSIIFTSLAASRAKCTIDINKDLPRPQPLMLATGPEGGFYLPEDSDGTLKFSFGDPLRLVCAGYGNHFPNITGSEKDVIATCFEGKTFNVSNVIVAFDQLACNSSMMPSAKRTGKTCLNNETYIDVDLGFGFGDEFFTTINACHDPIGLRTLYTSFNLTKKIEGGQKGYPRPRHWRQETFYGNYSMDVLYKVATQIKTMNEILGSEKDGEKIQYVTKKGGRHFARGHLAAKADFFYGTQQKSTFHHVNESPQWQRFNGGKWGSLENYIRKFASNTGQDIMVLTGVHGVLQLPRTNGTLEDLYLYANSKGSRAIPIPKYFWKLIYNPKTKLGTAFVGHNGPSLSTNGTENFLCFDISPKILWIKWHEWNSEGIVYACRVDDLRSVIETIPSLEVHDILV